MANFNRRQVLSGAGLALLFGSRITSAIADAASAAPKVLIGRGYTECRYGQLHYLRGAPASGVTRKPTLILLHQNPSSSVEYEYLVAAMAEDREVIAFDTPGSGMSDWPPKPMDMTGYAQAFSDGLKNLGLGTDQPVDVFGFHTGTLLGAELAIAEPDRVGRLVLSGIPYRTQEQRQKHLDEIEAGPKLTEDGAEILKMQRGLWEFVVSRRDPRVPLDRAARVYMEKAKPMDRYWWPYKSVWQYPFSERFPLITQPVLILQPHEALLEYSKRAAELIENSKFVDLPDLNRDVLDVGVAEISTELRRFLT
jgi:pimeloyl-ACP methyl ester carboxylesterase